MIREDAVDTVGLLIEIRDELRALRADLRPRSDPLVEAIVSAIGRGVVFSANELIENADAALLEITGNDAPMLGKRLAELARRGYVERCGRDGYGTLWLIPDSM